MKWKGKWLISLVVAFAMLFSIVVTAATEPTGQEDAQPAAMAETDPGTEEEFKEETKEDPESEPGKEDEESKEEIETDEEQPEEDDLPEESIESEDSEELEDELSDVLTNSVHEHDWSTDWNFDGIYHWHECDAEDCSVKDDSEKDGYAEHIYGDDNICIVCGLLNPDSLIAVISDDVPTPTEVYNAMIAYKDKAGYTQGTTWTNDTPYNSSNPYTFKGNGEGGVGCAAFAFILSDAAFGDTPNARTIYKGSFTFADVNVGDILRINGNTHSVIVLQKGTNNVIIAEGNYNSAVNWGRSMTETEVLAADFMITRYPQGYDPSNDSAATQITASGTLDGGLKWELTGAGTLTISGNGAMPDYSSTGGPWSSYNSAIWKIVIKSGVTSIGSCAFYGCGALSVEIPSTVKTIGDSAFRTCTSLASVSISTGVETIGENTFRGCTSLVSVTLPSSVGEVGAGTFMDCTAMTSVTFASGSKQVKMGDNLFTRCQRLASVTLPSSIDCIGEGMFMDCLVLTRVEIPQGAQSIGRGAFSSCKKLTAVVIPDSVTTIETAAFADCALTDIYYTGSESQWNSIGKIGDTATVLANVTIHYNYVPPASSDSPSPSHSHSDSGNGSSSSDAATADSQFLEFATPDEIKRYSCVGKEGVEYTLSADNDYPIDIDNALQGPLCFAAFEAVLEDYTIARTYNIFAFSDTVYSMDEEVLITIKIPSDVYEEDREYKMICVTENGLPIVYDDLDDDPETITIRTNTFYAYALIYK